jgi:hypothetical protein
LCGNSTPGSTNKTLTLIPSLRRLARAGGGSAGTGFGVTTPQDGSQHSASAMNSLSPTLAEDEHPRTPTTGTGSDDISPPREACVPI